MNDLSCEIGMNTTLVRDQLFIGPAPAWGEESWLCVPINSIPRSPG